MKDEDGRAIIKAFRLFAEGIEGAFDGNRKAFELIAEEHDKLVSIVKEQQKVIEGLLLTQQQDRVRRKFKEDNT